VRAAREERRDAIARELGGEDFTLSSSMAVALNGGFSDVI